jgi:hypothetical protein
MTLALRIGLGLLAASMALMGAWALFAPESFFEDFPGSGFRPVAALPPYNQHLVTDFGALNLALAFVVGAAAVTLSRPLVFAALGAVLINGLAHLAFHAGHQGTLSDSDQTSNLIALSLPVVLGFVLFLVEFARTPRPPLEPQEGQA